jgi:hypothetical protein
MNDVKFCMNCGLPFDKHWNKKFDVACINKDCCCAQCEKSYARKQRPRSQRRYGVAGIYS